MKTNLFYLPTRKKGAMSAKFAAARRAPAALRLFETRRKPTWPLSLEPFPSGGRRSFTVDDAHLRRSVTAFSYGAHLRRSRVWIMEGTSTCQAELGVKGASTAGQGWVWKARRLAAVRAGCGSTVDCEKQ